MESSAGAHCPLLEAAGTRQLLGNATSVNKRSHLESQGANAVARFQKHRRRVTLHLRLSSLVSNNLYSELKKGKKLMLMLEPSAGGRQHLLLAQGFYYNMTSNMLLWSVCTKTHSAANKQTPCWSFTPILCDLVMEHIIGE